MIIVDNIREWIDRYNISIDNNQCRCVDIECGLVVTWNKGNYNDTNEIKFTDNELIARQAQIIDRDLALYCSELTTLMSDYLFAFHYDLIFKQFNAKIKLVSPLKACRERLAVGLGMIEVSTGIDEHTILAAEQGKAPYSIIFQLLEYYGLGVNVAPLR